MIKYIVLIIVATLCVVNARFCPTCETAEDYRKAKFLAENIRSLTRALERSSKNDETVTNKLNQLCEASPMHEKENNLLTEIDNLDTQIKSTTKSEDQYQIPTELQTNLEKAQSDFAAKKSVLVCCFLSMTFLHHTQTNKQKHRNQ